MRYAVRYAIAATMVAGAAAAGHHHGHQHFHAKKEVASPVDKREADGVVEYVVAATETVYELAGELLDVDEAKEGLDAGNFIVIGETTPTYTPPPPPPEPTTTSAADMGAKFIESKSEAPETTSTSAPPPPPKPSPVEEPEEEEETISGGGIDSDFPSGKINCTEFPSDWGAIPLKWLGFHGWSGIQRVPDYTLESTSIFEIHTGIDGDDCEAGSMCTYACPAGYEPSQWPEAQGSDKESIGGLFCNSDGKLELTRDTTKKLCQKGAGGVSIRNELTKVVNTCRTAYPGTEAMVIPATAEPGETVELTNPYQDEFKWAGSLTSAQYYVNKAGYSTENACCWTSPIDPDGAGNWSPMIIGVGKAPNGITYLSIFLNLPMSHAKLNFNIEIEGDITSECSYIDGKFSGGSSTGCTVSSPSPGEINDILTSCADWHEGRWQGCFPLLLSSRLCTGSVRSGSCVGY